MPRRDRKQTHAVTFFNAMEMRARFQACACPTIIQLWFQKISSMPFISVTRLRLHSIRFLVSFAIQAARSKKQSIASPGCLGAEVRKTNGLAFWTLTIWDSEEAMRSFMKNSPHREVMPKLARWCDEAAVAHWVQESQVHPTWQEAADRLLKSGRLSRVSNPSNAQRNGHINVA